MVFRPMRNCEKSLALFWSNTAKLVDCTFDLYLVSFKMSSPKNSKYNKSASYRQSMSNFEFYNDFHVLNKPYDLIGSLCYVPYRDLNPLVSACPERGWWSCCEWSSPDNLVRWLTSAVGTYERIRLADVVPWTSWFRIMAVRGDLLLYKARLRT